jgi:death on curing protein
VIEFLTLEEVLRLHDASLARFGGGEGIINQATLESAVMQPQQTFDGEFLYQGLFEMAATYAHGISEGQAFVDGNKRTGVLAAIVFLRIYGITIFQHEEELYCALIDIANHCMTKDQLVQLFRRLAST